jgi:hypothetical protein
MLVYTYDYDSAYDGPALPIVEMEISAPDLGEQQREVSILQ